MFEGDIFEVWHADSRSSSHLGSCGLGSLGTCLTLGINLPLEVACALDELGVKNIAQLDLLLELSLDRDGSLSECVAHDSDNLMTFFVVLVLLPGLLLPLDLLGLAGHVVVPLAGT